VRNASITRNVYATGANAGRASAVRTPGSRGVTTRTTAAQNAKAGPTAASGKAAGQKGVKAQAGKEKKRAKPSDKAGPAGSRKHS
jgi:hypothetical protein